METPPYSRLYLVQYPISPFKPHSHHKLGIKRSIKSSLIMSKRSSNTVALSFTSPSKKQRLAVPDIKDIVSLSQDDLKLKGHQEVVQLFMDLKGAYQQQSIDKSEQIDTLIKSNVKYEAANKALEILNKNNATTIAKLEAQIAKGAAKPSMNTATPREDPNLIMQQAQQLRGVMHRAIKAQMKWAYVIQSSISKSFSVFHFPAPFSLPFLYVFLFYSCAILSIASHTWHTKLTLISIRPSCKTSGKRWSYTSMVPSPNVFYTLFGMDAAKELGAKKRWKQKKLSVRDFERVAGDCSVSVSFLFFSSSPLLSFGMEWRCEGFNVRPKILIRVEPRY